MTPSTDDLILAMRDQLEAVDTRVRLLYTNTLGLGIFAEKSFQKLVEIFSTLGDGAHRPFDPTSAQANVVSSLIHGHLREITEAFVLHEKLRTSKEFQEAEDICLPLLSEREKLEALRQRELEALAAKLHETRDALERRRAELLAHPDLVKTAGEVERLQEQMVKRNTALPR